MKRNSRRILVALLVAAAFVSVLFGRLERVQAAAFTVNSLGDTGAGSGLTGDLRYCITQAISTGGSHTITFGVTGTINLLSALPNLSGSALSINGPGASLLTIRRDSSVNTLRIFLVNSGTVTISGVTLADGNAVGGGAVRNFSNGTLNINNCVLANNAGNAGGGGAIINNGNGPINITNSTFSGNSASGGEGGAIRHSSTGTININGCTFSGNSATNLACLHNNSSGAINITNTVITGNSAQFDAGAISNSAGTVTVTGCTITNNTAGNVGGAIVNQSTGTVTVTDSTISGNSSNGTGGGIYTNAGTINLIRSTLSNNSTNFNGGGIHNNGPATINITNSTISGNHAGSSGSGGGLNFSNIGGAGQGLVTNSTITGNTTNTGGGIAVASGVSITIKNTIIAQNTANNNFKDISGTLTSGGYNLIGNNTGGTITPTTGDQIGTAGSPVNPQLGPLQNNGGPTSTHALLTGSPAIDAGSAFGLTTDQRGAARPFDVATISPATGGDNSDIGAVESGSFFVTVGGNTTVAPLIAPVGAVRINVSTSTNFKGTFAANPATGVVRITNAHPAGSYQVTVKAFDSGGAVTTSTFNLIVQTPSPACSNPTFTNAADVGMGTEPYSVAIGDFNNDGKQDIAVSHNISFFVSIRFGNGMGGFSGSTNVDVGPASHPGQGVQALALAVGDFNNDGNQDFATTNYHLGTVSIRLGDGMGGFTGATATSEIPVGPLPRAIAIGDFNGDGYQDFATADSNGGTASIRLGDGMGGFSGSTGLSVSAPQSVAIGDFNNDGKQDLAISTAFGSVAIRLGDGAGNFSGSTNIGVGGGTRTIAISDFNNDGKQDFATGNVGFSETGNTVSIRLGDGMGGFSGSTEVTVGTGPYVIAIGDFNNDGKQDFASADVYSDIVSIRLGDGLGGFGGTTSISVGHFPISVAIGDFNNDGKQDFAAANDGTNNVSVRLGACVVTCPTITLNPANLPVGLIGAAYDQPITATGGATPYTFVVTSGTVPAGLTLNSNGTWSGAPTTANNYNFTVQATDSNGCAASQTYSLAITNTCIWNGSVSNNWNTAANWTPRFVPSAPNDCIIPESGVGFEATLSAATATVNNLTIASPRTLTLSGQNLTVNAALVLNGGLIDTGASTLRLGTAASISRSGGQVTGNLSKQFGGAGSFIYTVGTANGYSPVDVMVTAGAGELTVKAVEGPQPVVNASQSLRRYWSLTGSGVTVNLAFHYLDPLDIPPGGSDANYRIIRVSGGTASTFPNDCAGGSPCVNPATNTAIINNVTSFSDWTMGEPSGPTAVDLAQFTATAYDGGALIEWQTGFEASNLGFNLYRDDSGVRVPVNSQMIAGSALLAGADTVLKSGRTYSYRDGNASGKAAVYWLESVGLNGQSMWHGPYSAQVAGGAAPSRSLSPFIGQINPAQAGRTRPVERAAQMQSVKSGQITVQTGPAGQAAVKLWVRREGWYRVAVSDLVLAGLDVRANAAFLQLYADGQQVPINTVSDKQGQLAAIEFYGRGIDAAFTDSRVYWLITGTKPGLRVPVVKADGFATAAQSFLYTVERRDRTIYFSALRNGERENFFGPVIASQAVEQALRLEAVDQRPGGAATIEVALQGVTMQPHKVWVYLNGVFTGELNFDGQAEGVASFSVSQSLLKSGDNEVKFVAQGGPSDISLVDYIRIAYWHSFAAEDNALQFTAPGRQSVTINGFTNGAIRVLDVTEPDSAQELSAKIEQQKSGYAVTVTSPDSGERRLLAFADQQSIKPSKIAANRTSGWRSATNGADLIIISRQDLLSGLQPLVLLRQSQGLKVAIVDVEDIYDEFSFGNKSPQAVKDFLYYAKTCWKIKPRYVLFAGDASYDAKDYLGFGDWDIVPTKLVDTELMEAASDDWFVDFNNDALPDLSIGRLPARGSEEIGVMVKKITGYERTESSQSVLLVADSNDGFDFDAANRSLQDLLPDNLRVTEINRSRMDEATAKSRLLDAIGEGQKLINYTGHGSVSLWRGGLLTNDDARSLTNGERLPVFVLMTCLNGYFDDPALDGLAESLMKAEGGGAVAAWASSAMTTPDAQLLMNQQLYRSLFASPTLSLGEAVRTSKSVISNIDVRRTWILLGDPTMRLR
ncbi:MAG: C25 family cysteine peptidase [Blastocatellia bacterium]